MGAPQRASGDTKYFGVELPLDGGVQRQNAGFLAPNQTKIAVCVDNIATTANITVPLPTPPVGKIWMITDISFSHTVATGQRFALQVGGIVDFALPVHGSAAPDIMNSFETQPDIPGGIAPSLFITGAGSMNSFANIYGIQQNIGAG